MTNSKRFTAACLLLLLTAGILLYSNAINAPLQFDDTGYIKDDPGVHMIDLDLGSLKKAALEGLPRNRPVPNITFAINYYFGRLAPAGYHWVNIIIHCLSSIFLFFFAKDTLLLYAQFRQTNHTGLGNALNFSTPKNTAAFIALFAAMLWLVHPVNSSAVTYIVQRMTSLAAMFYMLSLLLYVKGRKSQQPGNSLKGRTIIFFAGALLTGICAFASKQNTATLPLFILLYEWVFFQQLKPIQLKNLKVFVAFAVIVFAAAGLYYLGADPIERILNGYARRDFTPSQRLLTEFRVVIYYIGLLVFPGASRFILDHDYPLSHSLITPFPTLISLAAIIALTSLAFYRPRHHTLLFFAVLWFFGHLMIESTVIPIEIIYEHRNYLPLMMPCLLVALYAYKLLQKYKWLYAGILVLVIISLGTQTWQRNAIWQDPVVFARDGASKAPNKFRPRHNLGVNLKDQGRMAEAITVFNQAIEIEPRNPEKKSKKAQCYNTLGLALLKNDEPVRAIDSFMQALKLVPDYHHAEINIARAMIKQGRPEDALTHLSAFLSKHPGVAEAHMTMGDAYVKLQNLQKAAVHFRKTLENKPNHAKAHNSLGNVLAQQGRTQKAISHFRQAIHIEPNFAGAYSNLGNTLARAGRFKDAIKNYEKALAINPEYQKAKGNLKKVKTFMKKKF